MTKHNLRIQALIEVEKAKIQVMGTINLGRVYTNKPYSEKQLFDCIDEITRLAESFEDES